MIKEQLVFLNAIHSRNVVHSDQGFTKVNRELIDGDHHVTDGGVSVVLRPPQVHRELLEGTVTIGHQVVLAHAGELEHISVKCLEVLAAPGAADAADVVPNWERRGYRRFIFAGRNGELKILKTLRTV